MHGAEAYHCDACAKRVTAERRMRLTVAPKHLVLTLMRFRYNLTTFTREKIGRRVVFPASFRLPKGVASEQEAMSMVGVEYELYGVVVHAGGSAQHGR